MASKKQGKYLNKWAQNLLTNTTTISTLKAVNFDDNNIEINNTTPKHIKKESLTNLITKSIKKSKPKKNRIFFSKKLIPPKKPLPPLITQSKTTTIKIEEIESKRDMNDLPFLDFESGSENSDNDSYTPTDKKSKMKYKNSKSPSHKKSKLKLDNKLSMPSANPQFHSMPTLPENSDIEDGGDFRPYIQPILNHQNSLPSLASQSDTLYATSECPLRMRNESINSWISNDETFTRSSVLSFDIPPIMSMNVDHLRTTLPGYECSLDLGSEMGTPIN